GSAPPPIHSRPGRNPTALVVPTVIARPFRESRRPMGRFIPKYLSLVSSVTRNPLPVRRRSNKRKCDTADGTANLYYKNARFVCCRGTLEKSASAVKTKS